MVYRIHYVKLNKELKKRINEKTIPADELKKVYENFIVSINKKKKTINIVMIIVAVLFGVMLLPIITKASDPKLTKFMLTMIIPAIVIIYLAVYFTQVGLIKTQFNNAIKKNYPELAKELGL